MKKLILLMAVSMLGLTVNAQTEAGKMLVGGAIRISNYKTDPGSQKGRDLSIAPSIGLFASKNFAIGTSIGYFSSRYDQATTYNDNVFNTHKVREQLFVVAPYARLYKDINNQFKLFGHLSVPLSFGRSDVEYFYSGEYTKVSTRKNIGVSLSPGVAFFPSSKIGIELSVDGISYNDQRYNFTDDNSLDSGQKRFTLGADLFAPNIGIQFYF